jgi:glycosyltransferase involved in cell wall biosynthesis
MMAKVTLFITNLEGGGAERVMVTLANQFARQGHQVDFLLMHKTGVYLKEVAREVNVIDMQRRRTRQSLKPLMHYLREACPDGILSSLPYPNMLNIIAARLVRTQATVVVREANTPSLRTRWADQLKDRVFERLVKYLYRYADWVVAVSRGVQRDLLQYTRVLPERVALIYNPTYTHRLLELREQPVEHPWFAPGEPPVVLGVGRFYLQKDFATLIRAFAKVRASRPARLVILGDGPLRAELEALSQQLGIAEHVSMPGFVENPFAYMRRAAVFVLPSRFEGLPNVLIQAMACGCPVVSTNCPSGVEDVLDNGRYGHLVPVGDVEAMARAILRVLEGDVPHVPEEWLLQFHEEHVAQQYLALLLNRVGK